DPAARQSLLQELARPAKTLPNGAFFEAELLGDLGGAFVLEAAGDERGAEGFGQVADFSVEEHLYFLPGGTKGGGARRQRADARLVSAPPGGGPFCVGGHTIRNSVKPAGQGLFLPDGSGLLGQDEEGGLEGVLGVVEAPEGAQADAQDHRPVPPQ